MIEINQPQFSDQSKKQCAGNTYMNCGQIIFKNFAVRPSEEFLGISVQKQRMYVVQKKCISVFEYFAKSPSASLLKQYEPSKSNQSLPILIKQIFLPYEISKYVITEKYICIKSKNKTEIRDNQFEKVFYAENKGIMTTIKKEISSKDSDNLTDKKKDQAFSYDTEEELELECQIVDNNMFSWKVISKKRTNNPNPKDMRYLRQYYSEKVNIFTKEKSFIRFRNQIIDPNNKTKKVEICKPPLFINQLGLIQNFYIWPYSSVDIQMGIYFKHKDMGQITENSLYEICNFQLRDNHVIKQVYFYDYRGVENNKQKGPHLFFAICEGTYLEQSRLKLMLFEILPEQKQTHHENEAEALNKYLDEFNQLRRDKKMDQTLSPNPLLNQILGQFQKGKNDDFILKHRPTTVLETIILKQSGEYRKSFYNPITKVLWVDDLKKTVYRIQFETPHSSKEGDSYVERIEEYRNESSSPQLQGTIYDLYPLYKRKSLSLEIGIRGHPVQSNENKLKEPEQQEQDEQIIDLDDQQLEAIEKENKIRNFQDFDLKKNSNNIPQENYNLKSVADQQVQTQFLPDPQNIKPQQQKIEQAIHYIQSQNNHILLEQFTNKLNPLNFTKIQDSLIRFSSIFVANINKNINKLRDVNQKIKQEIKSKITKDIFDLVKQVFQPLLSQTLGTKIQQQLAKGRQFVQKVFNKHIEQFNTLMLQDNAKQESIKKYILQEQIKSVNIIKEASVKFIQITKIREMQKIAYNEATIQTINQIGQQIKGLQDQVNIFIKLSEESEEKLFNEIQEIKKTFKLLILQDRSENQQEDNVVDGFQSDSQAQEDEESQGQNIKHQIKDKEPDGKKKNQKHSSDTFIYPQQMDPRLYQPQQYPYLSHSHPYPNYPPNYSSYVPSYNNRGYGQGYYGSNMFIPPYHPQPTSQQQMVYPQQYYQTSSNYFSPIPYETTKPPSKPIKTKKSKKIQEQQF